MFPSLGLSLPPFPVPCRWRRSGGGWRPAAGSERQGTATDARAGGGWPRRACGGAWPARERQGRTGARGGGRRPVRSRGMAEARSRHGWPARELWGSAAGGRAVGMTGVRAAKAGGRRASSSDSGMRAVVEAGANVKAGGEGAAEAGGRCPHGGRARWAVGLPCSMG
ncbi:hypothetical protein GQ55_8G027500 [Panicum hallii var. hallii]|uniref:DUF834 domain-containing protein n=1 Tax=Panicum hallii var. hallii TaxID=1504633 RepID=A0A2T7CK18_9POAL|nr:hypothetical protein GQ55_8G027500 [Panicum hallii var. hallii]